MRDSSETASGSVFQGHRAPPPAARWNTLSRREVSGKRALAGWAGWAGWGRRLDFEESDWVRCFRKCRCDDADGSVPHFREFDGRDQSGALSFDSPPRTGRPARVGVATRTSGDARVDTGGTGGRCPCEVSWHLLSSWLHTCRATCPPSLRSVDARIGAT